MASNFSPMYFEQPIVIFDTTQALSRTSGSFVLYGGVSLNATHDSTSITNGSFVVAGGVGIGKNLNVGGIQTISNTAESTGTGNGALVVSGGVGIAKDLNVGGDATITGNLYVNGTTTYVNTQTIDVSDNTLVLNAGPAGTSDAGILIHRAGEDVTEETAVISGTLTSLTTGSAVLPTSVTQSNYFNGWWIKTAGGQIAQILNYSGDGTNGTLTFFTQGNTLTNGSANLSNLSFELYNRSYLAQYYDETSDEVRFAYIADAEDPKIDLENFNNYADLRVNSLYANTGISSGDLWISGLSTIANLAVTDLLVASVSMENAELQSATIGALFVTGESILHGGVTAGTLYVTGASILDLGVTAGTINVTGDSILHGGITAGSLYVTGASYLHDGITTGCLNVTGASLLQDDVTITSANVIISTNDYSPILNATVATGGSILMNTVDVSPSLGDISRERYFSANNNQSIADNITGFVFSNSVVRAFDAIVSVTIYAGGNSSYAYYNLKGVQKNGNWVLNSSFVGDITGFTFSINGSGQIQYTSTNIASFTSSYVNFRALTTSVITPEI